MELDPTILAALIGVGSGVLSAAVTTRLSTTASRIQAQRTDAKSAAFLTSQVAPELQRYAAACLNVADDDGYDEGRPAGSNGCAEATVMSPTFTPTDSTVEWKALDEKLMLEILTFPEHSPITTGIPSGDYEDPPDYSAYFNDRQRRHADLGLYALTLVERLHAYVGHGQSQNSLQLKARLEERRQELEIERAQSEQRVQAAHERLQALAPPMPPSSTC